MSITVKNQSGKVLAPGAGDSFSMLGITVTPKVASQDTNGAYCLLEQQVSPGAGSPPHIIHNADKVIYVVNGRFAVLLGQETVQAEAGACVIIPRGVIHNFKNVGSEPGKILVSLNPAGHEDFLRDLSRVVQGGPPDPAKMVEVGQRHHVELLLNGKK
ncbi:MAG: cupin domain-containing protein [Anaerolineae bacterium]|nr:cupin domain-containing protein [Anaerolineales bacterium]